MANDNGSGFCCTPGGSYRVEAVVSVDERGQMVLPKEMREKAGIRAGDKLALAAFERDGKVCCMLLIKAEDLAGMVKELLGPMLGELGSGKREAGSGKE